MTIQEVALALVADGKGILAMDESSGTIEKRFTALGVESSEDTRWSYRYSLVSVKGLGQFISGVILFDETIRSKDKQGVAFTELLAREGILSGIKVDMGAKDFEGHPGEKNTLGLEGLPERLKEYKELGASFAKWRAVITIGEGIPTDDCIAANATGLAKYGKMCQDAGIVPIIEPEVLIDGDHTIEKSFEVSKKVQEKVFEALNVQGVALDGMILKPSMVISGKECAEQATPEEVAAQTVACLKATVPLGVPGCAFLSGGQSDEQAASHLNLMNKNFTDVPFKLTFSYGRALQREAMAAWAGKDENQDLAREAVLKKAKVYSEASLGTL
ncbi:MAG: fructose-bisphosphate aldolase class I [Nanoarchaeota archaeon]|nr:fructose-bisphosphate aldolase class I [Nanoarchaeota archaeon]